MLSTRSTLSEKADKIASYLGLLDDSYIALIPRYNSYHALSALGPRPDVPRNLEDVHRRLRRFDSFVSAEFSLRSSSTLLHAFAAVAELDSFHRLRR